MSAVNCVKGKDAEGPGSDFELVVIITAMKLSPQNFWCVQNDLLLPCYPFSYDFYSCSISVVQRDTQIEFLLNNKPLPEIIFSDQTGVLCSNGSWRSVWNIDFQDESQVLNIKGKLQVTMHDL